MRIRRSTQRSGVRCCNDNQECGARPGTAVASSRGMAARSIWKGHLRLSLVTIPIRVYPATNTSATVRFNQLHRECQTRIQYKKWCPHCEREVTNDEIVKGYEFERGRYV